MLEVVEHEQEYALSKEAHQLLLCWPLTTVPQTDRVRDRRDDQSGIAHGSEVNPDHPVGEVLGDIVSKRLGQARLTDAAGPSERQERNAFIE
jgi:hypothetical protein